MAAPVNLAAVFTKSAGVPNYASSEGLTIQIRTFYLL
jgi:hypothetical protein